MTSRTHDERRTPPPRTPPTRRAPIPPPQWANLFLSPDFTNSTDQDDEGIDGPPPAH